MQGYGSKNKSYLVFFVILILLLVLANIFSLSARNFFYAISAPLQETLWGAGQSVSNLFGGIGSMGSAKDEINRLKLENNELSTKIVLLQETQDENTALKEALGLELNKKYELVLAKFMSKNPDGDIVSLNKGKNDGIEEGMPVITVGGVVAGKIKEVYSSYSKASLLSAKKLTFDVRIKHEDQDISAVAEGQGDSRLNLSFIPQDAKITDGDVVVTDCLGNIFPELLGVGKIKSIKKSDTSPFQEAEIEQFFDLKSALDIFIVKAIK